jgi:alpha-L-rhamnosidase
MFLGGTEAAAKCDPPAPACFLDGMGPQPPPDNSMGDDIMWQQQQIDHTGVHASMFVAGCGLLTPVKALELLPFLKAKSTHMPLYSAMASNFMLEALYRMATAETETSEAADLAFDILTRDGHRSWMEMIAHNATMAIEHWYGTSIDRHTWSHPWSASPARIIPQWLMGVRPIDLAWRRIAVHPQPGTKLKRASMHVPTLRGMVHCAFEISGGSFVMNLTIPGNTRAEVCLPTGVLGVVSAITLNGNIAPTTRPADRQGQLCLTHDLAGGMHSLRAT